LRKATIIIVSILILSGFNALNKAIDPAGTYKLVSKTKNKGGEIYGYTGFIQVKKISEYKIVMTFEINKGAPSYNSGSFVDTLNYKNNQSIFRNVEADPTCSISFDFSKKGVKVKETTADFNFGCGFGHAVIANGYFKKVSSKIPILIEPLTGEKLEK
jgi:hypothetical protein